MYRQEGCVVAYTKRKIEGKTPASPIIERHWVHPVSVLGNQI
jgi:hypothetical protein